MDLILFLFYILSGGDVNNVPEELSSIRVVVRSNTKKKQSIRKGSVAQVVLRPIIRFAKALYLRI